jgi:hypothetical protein
MIYGEYPLKIDIVKTFDALPVSQVYAKWGYIEIIRKIRSLSESVISKNITTFPNVEVCSWYHYFAISRISK